MTSYLCSSTVTIDFILADIKVESSDAYLFVLQAFLDTVLSRGNSHERDSYIGPMQGAIPTQLIPQPVEVGHTPGVYAPYSFRIVVWVLLRPTRTDQ